MLPRMRAGWVALALMLAACAEAPAAPSIRRLEQAATSQPQAPTPSELLLPFLAKVGLSAAQTQQIDAIILEAYPKPDQAQAQQDAQAMQAVLQSDPLDVDRLRELLTKQETEQRTMGLKLVDVLQAVRPLLTQTQLAKAVQALKNPKKRPQQEAPPPEEPSTLTAEQQQAFEAAKPAAKDPRVVLAAMATLLETGEADDLTAALTPGRDVASQVDAEVQAFSTLTAEQRRQMAQPPQQDASAAPG